MEEIATLRHRDADGHVPRVRLLVADDDRSARALLTSCLRDVVGAIVVLEAEDGGEAIQLGLQRDPHIALFDVDMPRLGGIEAAITLRELKPRVRVALWAGDPRDHCERARECSLPLFAKQELDGTLAWLRAAVRWWVETELVAGRPRKRDFVCRACGYGALRSDAPDRCPMCQAERAWVEIPPRSAMSAAR